MPLSNPQLWNKIDKLSLDDKNAQFTFSMRLARDRKWSLRFTEKAIREYKKFIYLSCVSNTPVTPSEEVDEVWHQHLTYTKSYWHDLCRDTVERQIHHNPTTGGLEEDQKFLEQYLATLDLYVREFDEKPGKSIWPSHEIRFNLVKSIIPSMDRVLHLSSNWKFRLIGLSIMLSLATGAAYAADETTSDNYLWIILVGGAIILAVVLGKNNNNGGCGSCSSGCGGGCGD